jgi:hypothetical protein
MGVWVYSALLRSPERFRICNYLSSFPQGGYVDIMRAIAVRLMSAFATAQTI